MSDFNETVSLLMGHNIDFSKIITSLYIGNNKENGEYDTRICADDAFYGHLLRMYADIVSDGNENSKMFRDLHLREMNLHDAHSALKQQGFNICPVCGGFIND